MICELGGIGVEEEELWDRLGLVEPFDRRSFCRERKRERIRERAVKKFFV